MFFEKCAVYKNITSYTEEPEESLEIMRHICAICMKGN
jgi:hypothetical protein